MNPKPNSMDISLFPSLSNSTPKPPLDQAAGSGHPDVGTRTMRRSRRARSVALVRPTSAELKKRGALARVARRNVGVSVYFGNPPKKHKQMGVSVLVLDPQKKNKKIRLASHQNHEHGVPPKKKTSGWHAPCYTCCLAHRTPAVGRGLFLGYESNNWPSERLPIEESKVHQRKKRLPQSLERLAFHSRGRLPGESGSLHVSRSGTWNMGVVVLNQQHKVRITFCTWVFPAIGAKRIAACPLKHHMGVCVCFLCFRGPPKWWFAFGFPFKKDETTALSLVPLP